MLSGFFWKLVMHNTAVHDRLRTHCLTQQHHDITQQELPWFRRCCGSFTVSSNKSNSAANSQKRRKNTKHLKHNLAVACIKSSDQANTRADSNVAQPRCRATTHRRQFSQSEPGMPFFGQDLALLNWPRRERGISCLSSAYEYVGMVCRYGEAAQAEVG